jgi:hypothetical protein
VIDSVSDPDATVLKRLTAQGVTPSVRLHTTRSIHDELVLRTGVWSKPLRLPRSVAEARRIRPAKGVRQQVSQLKGLVADKT